MAINTAANAEVVWYAGHVMARALKKILFLNLTLEHIVVAEGNMIIIAQPVAVPLYPVLRGKEMNGAATVMALEGIAIIFVKEFKGIVLFALASYPSHPLNHSRMLFEYLWQLAG